MLAIDIDTISFVATVVRYCIFVGLVSTLSSNLRLTYLKTEVR
jgi:hypothetical protein